MTGPATTDDLDGVRDHDRATGPTGRLKTVLALFGAEDRRLTSPTAAVFERPATGNR